MSEQKDLFEKYCLAIIARIDEMCIDVADINERTKHLAIEGKGHKADTPSTKGESNLNNEPNSSKESKGISTSYPTYGNCVETMNPQLTKDCKKTSNFDLVPIAFIAACIAAAGGFDFSDPKHADILTTLAIESKIYLVVDELYDFIKELKHIIFQFLMDDMGWKRDSELGACVTLREIIDAVDSIDATKMHPNYIDRLHRKMADDDIYQWVFQLKMAVYDERLRPKMYEFWIEFNKEVKRDPTQNFGCWAKNYFSQYTDISKPIKQAQIYKLLQDFLPRNNFSPMDRIPDFKIPYNYSLNAAFSKNSKKRKNKRNKKQQRTALRKQKTLFLAK
ncbi:unnamed protein product [Hanseniaspora opuntiae]